MVRCNRLSALHHCLLPALASVHHPVHAGWSKYYGATCAAAHAFVCVLHAGWPILLRALMLPAAVLGWYTQITAVGQGRRELLGVPPGPLQDMVVAKANLTFPQFYELLSHNVAMLTLFGECLGFTRASAMVVIGL